jgi:hypothetical protein
MGTKPTDRSVYPDGTPTCAVVIVGPNLPTGDATFHVHDAECGDRRKGVYRGFDAQAAWDDVVEARDVREVVDEIFYNGGSFYTESGWEGMEDGSVTEAHRNEIAWVEYVGEFKFMPCVQLPRDIGGLRHTTREPEAMTDEVEETLDEVLDSPELAAVLALPEAEVSLEDITVPRMVAVVLDNGYVAVSAAQERFTVHRTDIPALITALANALVQEA